MNRPYIKPYVIKQVWLDYIESERKRLKRQRDLMLMQQRLDMQKQKEQLILFSSSKQVVNEEELEEDYEMSM